MMGVTHAWVPFPQDDPRNRVSAAGMVRRVWGQGATACSPPVPLRELWQGGHRRAPDLKELIDGTPGSSEGKGQARPFSHLG